MKKLFHIFIASVLLVFLFSTGVPVLRASADTGMPAPVITALQNRAGGIKLSWSKVSDADYYRVYYKYPDASDNKWKLLMDTESEECLCTRVTNVHCIRAAFKIRAVRTDPETGKVKDYSTSKIKSKTWVRKPTAGYVKKGIKNQKNGIAVFYSVARDLGEQGFIVYRKAPGESSYTRIGKQKSGKGAFIDLNVTEGETYSYRICVYSAGSKSAKSKAFSITRTAA